MKYNRQNLVNAEVNISRAQWMANKIDSKNPNPADESYVVENIKTAIKELQLSIGIVDKPIKKVAKP